DQIPSAIQLVHDIQSWSKPFADIFRAHEQKESHPMLELAENVADWMMTETTANNTYVLNSRSILQAGHADVTSSFHMGILASWPAGYQRDKARSMTADKATYAD